MVYHRLNLFVQSDVEHYKLTGAVKARGFAQTNFLFEGCHMLQDLANFKVFQYIRWIRDQQQVCELQLMELQQQPQNLGWCNKYSNR